MALKCGATVYSKIITNDLWNESIQKRSFYDHNYYYFFFVYNCMWSVNDVLAGNCNRLAVFPALRMFRPGPQNHYFVLFCQKIAQNTPWWVLGALVPTNSIMSISFWNLRYEMDHTCCWLLCNFECQFLHVHLQDNIFVVCSQNNI